jgi:hypothetical protein
VWVFFKLLEVMINSSVAFPGSNKILWCVLDYTYSRRTPCQSFLAFVVHSLLQWIQGQRSLVTSTREIRFSHTRNILEGRIQCLSSLMEGNCLAVIPQVYFWWFYSLLPLTLETARNS